MESANPVRTSHPKTPCTWPLTALVAGSAAGGAVTSSLAQADNWRLAVLLGCLVAAAGAITAVWRRTVLDRAVVCD